MRLNPGLPDEAYHEALIQVMSDDLTKTLVENFILFDRTEGEVQKIVARNHQYLGVNRVIDKLQSKEPVVRALRYRSLIRSP